MALFLQYCQREFDLDQIDMDKFQMNGKLEAIVFYIFKFVFGSFLPGNYSPG